MPDLIDDSRTLVVAVFLTDGPVFTADGTPTISGVTDMLGMFTSTSMAGAGEGMSTYRDPETEPEAIADVLTAAAAQFRMRPTG